ncbi:MAG: hypothetical protein FWD35_02045 [Oscillospiraceae bacterium]|nr:hypothetical protein [Oscillospiraceae bacterium]
MRKLFAVTTTVVLIALMICGLTACDKEPEIIETPPPDEVFAALEDAGFFEAALTMRDVPESRLSDLHIVPDDAVSFVAKEAAISAVFLQLILIEAHSERLGAVHTAMLEYQSALQQNATAYPQGAVAAAASRVGSRGNLIWLICDGRAIEIEQAIIDLITGE